MLTIVFFNWFSNVLKSEKLLEFLSVSGGHSAVEIARLEWIPSLRMHLPKARRDIYANIAAEMVNELTSMLHQLEDYISPQAIVAVNMLLRNTLKALEMMVSDQILQPSLFASCSNKASTDRGQLSIFFQLTTPLQVQVVYEDHDEPTAQVEAPNTAVAEDEHRIERSDGTKYVAGESKEAVWWLLKPLPLAQDSRQDRGVYGFEPIIGRISPLGL